MTSKVVLTMESRIHGDMYVRFGGGLAETYHRKVAKRCWPSLLKEIATLCNIDSALNTHKARRTFASTVTLNNGVPITIVKEMLGHSSVKQTEDYAMTEQETVGHEMTKLARILSVPPVINEVPNISDHIQKLEKELIDLKDDNKSQRNSNISQKLAEFEEGLKLLKSKIKY